MGDFNLEYSKNTSEKGKLVEFFDCRQSIDSPTTENNPTIDLVFANIPEGSIDSGVLEISH